MSKNLNKVYNKMYYNNKLMINLKKNMHRVVCNNNMMTKNKL